jgi:mannose/fructose/N-acetylgalactosamine-specific phosphotransferase system component IIB
MKVFLLLKNNNVYSIDIVNISQFINKTMIDNSILLEYNELSTYTKKLTTKGYICEIVNKSFL